MKDQRDYRSYQPVNQDQGRTGQAVNTNNDQNIRQQRELKPNVSQESANIVPETIDKMSKPGEQANPGDIGSRNARNQSNQPVAQEKQQRNYSKPGTTQQKYQARTPQNYQQQKKYEKPGVSNERKSGQVQSYTPPSYSKPRSSKDYSNFGARSYKPENRQTPKMDNSPGQPTQQKNVRNYSKTVLPKTGSHLPSQREGSNYSSPSTPQRSYSSPSPSSSPSRSYSAPSSSSPSRSSGSGSSGGSSGSPRKSR